MHPRLRLLCSLVLGLLALPLLVLAAGPPPAFATRAISHGQGVVWAGDGTSWLGNYLLDDGLHGYCIDVEKPPPVGGGLEYAPGTQAGWHGADDSARLAFISREWGSPADPLTAAAAQLATWTITGLAGHDQAYFARRANGDAAAVLAAANHMIAIANGASGASRGVSASLALALDGPGARVVTELSVDHLAGARTLPPRSFTGTMSLRGAVFADGSRTAAVQNGVALAIRPDQGGATETVTAEVRFTGLPFGADYRLGRSTAGLQSLLVSAPYLAEAAAAATATAPSELPFTPRVATVTSEAVAAPGTELSDLLTLSVHPESATGAAWGVYRSLAGALEPIPVVVESVLWGPFGSPPVEAARPPAGAPRVCSVELAVEGGPGTYRTPPCTVTAAGYYVWTDSIDPARTPRSRGGDRLRPWSSWFGVASETTVVQTVPAITTVASHHALAGAECVSDRLAVTGLPEGVPALEVTSTLLGPLTERPPTGQTPPGWESFPVAGSVVSQIDRDGTHESPCIRVSAPGFYYFVFSSESSSTSSRSEGGRAGITGALIGITGAQAGVEGARAGVAPLVPAFSDTRVHLSESVELRGPAVPPVPPTTPPVPPAQPPIAPPAPSEPTPTPVPPAGPPPAGPPQSTLPRTGAGSPPAMQSAVAVAAVMAGLAGLSLALRRRS
jgi:hypothetical protein